MSWLENTSSIVGVVGGLLGAWTWLGKYKKDKIEKRDRTEEDVVFAELTRVQKSQPAAQLWRFEVGTKEYQMMERLVKRGRLRPYMGGFMMAEGYR